MERGLEISPAATAPARVDWVRWVLNLTLAGAAVYAFWVAPVAYEEPRMCTWQWLIGHWSNVSNYSHGPLIPLIASFLLWWNVSHREPADTDWRPYWRAVGGGGAALAIWLVGGSQIGRAHV